MNIKKIVLALVFADFVALTGYAIATEPLSAMVDAITANWWSVQIFVDLCLAASFGCVWLWRDAKARGINPLPWVLAVPLTGSLALMLYALRRPSAHASKRTVVAAAT